MILSVEPIAAALEAIAAARGPSRRILLTPRGALFDQARARALAAETHLTLDLRALRGDRRAGDARWSTRSCESATSCWRAARWRPQRSSRRSRGSSPASSAAHSPPATNRSRRGASSTRNGPARRPGTASRSPRCCSRATTEAIARWRHRQALKVTQARRPDLIAAHPLSDEERRLLGASSEASPERLLRPLPKPLPTRTLDSRPAAV